MKELLSRARHQIIGLRRRNELLEAQMGIVNVFAVALGLRPENQGAEVDIAWELEREIDRLTAEEKKNAVPQNIR